MINMRTETITCDVCKGKENITTTQLDVIFHTDQTEGRGVKPHLSREKVDLCPRCKSIVLLGNYIHGQGAMGNNKYFFQQLNEEALKNPIEQ